MGKEQYEIKVSGYLKTGIKAETHNASKVNHFKNADNTIVIHVKPNDTILLSTKENLYVLKKHDSLNIYKGVCNGVKVQVSLKKIVGKLIYWA